MIFANCHVVIHDQLNNSHQQEFQRSSPSLSESIVAVKEEDNNNIPACAWMVFEKMFEGRSTPNDKTCSYRSIFPEKYRTSRSK
jgi:hypothetical protein